MPDAGTSDGETEESFFFFHNIRTEYQDKKLSCVTEINIDRKSSIRRGTRNTKIITAGMHRLCSETSKEVTEDWGCGEGTLRILEKIGLIRLTNVICVTWCGGHGNDIHLQRPQVQKRSTYRNFRQTASGTQCLLLLVCYD